MCPEGHSAHPMPTNLIKPNLIEKVNRTFNQNANKSFRRFNEEDGEF
jgi:hypothetical protein